MTSGRKALFAALAAVLLGAVALIVYGETRPLKRTFYGSVKDLLPKPEEIPGWSVQYLPIADTPEMQARVSEILNYDDAVYAVYTRGTERISVYIAYWTPGKMPHRFIAEHTPDVCWVSTGWRTTDTSKWRIAGFLEGELRTMVKESSTEHVGFCHIVSGSAESYGTQGRPPWYAAILDVVYKGVRQREEQMFMRFSSDLEHTRWVVFEPYLSVEKKFRSLWK